MLMLIRISKKVLIAFIFTGFHFINSYGQKYLPVDKVLITVSSPAVPLFTNNSQNVLLKVRVYVPADKKGISFNEITGNANRDAVKSIDSVQLFYTGIEPSFSDTSKLGGIKLSRPDFKIPFHIDLKPGLHYIWLTASIKNNASLDARPEVHMKINPGKGNQMLHEEGTFKKRMGLVLRKKGENGVNTYRIPGIVTTDKGTLIAVYDIRYNSAHDLPADIDVGMSRSGDGGRTWEKMKVIMDMGEPHSNNGIGDPSILFNPVTKRIWVAALWSKGNHSIAGSLGGLSPDSTGQFILVNSSDDGLTRSKPINITAQVKDPKWKIFFQGPGSGISMHDGTLVFPAQYWDENKIPHSTIVYSNDHGQTWKRGTGAKSNTTECAIVETTPGTLLLNMRDNRGHFRSTSTSMDMGKTWTETFNSYEALPDPVCMASLIKGRKGEKEILFFSNQNNQYARTHTTVKASADYGNTWPLSQQLLIDERNTFGYSSLTQINGQTLGLLYEGVRDLYFVRIPISEVIKGK